METFEVTQLLMAVGSVYQVRTPGSEDLLMTVKDRDWENDAVFSPNPNRPKSSGARSSSGLRLPGRIASCNSDSDIPRPSSMMQMRDSAPAQ